MKRIAVIALAWTGALALLGVALALLINSQAPGYEKVAKEEFGSPEAIRAIEKLYVRIETSPLSPELKIIPVFSPNPAYPTVRRIPKAWMPQEFPYWGAFHDMEIVEGTDVVAYYDSNKAFVAMEFLGTRYGCFISRDPNRCPPRFGTLQRLADNPLFITSRIGLGPGDNGGN
jgi:hypothetical protein